MTLKNLLGISLDAIQPDAATVGKALASTERGHVLTGLKAHRPHLLPG